MAVELRTNVIIGGRTDSSFDALAAKIASVAAAIDALGRPMREFGSDALDTFKDYETYMLEAKGAMSANYSSATLLEKAYNNLQVKAQEWASTSIFHTDDVAKAISEAAHAGWDYNEMLEGIPNAMLLAQAGNIDLSSGLDYLIKTINGTGTAFEDSGALVDQWVMAANSSATTVQELGEAMTKMGATARFGDSNAELLALLGTLANAGAVGTEAGTLLRNTMIRLIAPTDKAGAAMDILGASAEEIENVLADTTITKAAKQLQGLGFSAYDSEGKLKPMIDIFQELNECLSGLNEQTQNELLSAIFPTRTITGARAILEAIGELPALYEKILGSNGYAERVAEIQTSGLMGAEEMFYSKWEEFQRKVGEELSGQMKDIYGFAGGIVDKLNGMDPVTLSTLTGMFEGIAVAGPFLGGVSTAMFAIRHLGVAGTGILLAAAGVGALTGYLTKINEMELENTFGTMQANLTDIGTALSGVSQDLANQMDSFTKYGEAAEAAAAKYEEAGTTLTENLWTKMVTGATVEKDSEEYKALEKGAETMIGAMKEGITKSTEEKIKLVDYLFDTNVFNEENKASDPLYASLMSLITTGYDDAIATANQKGAELRKAITSAFDDGKLTESEMENIQRIQAEMDELMAGLNGYDVNKYKMLEKSQRVSLDSMKDFTEEVEAARKSSASELQDEYTNLAAYTRARYDWAVAHGANMYDPNTGEWVSASSVNIDDMVNDLYTKYQGKMADIDRAYDDYIVKGWNNAFKTSDAGGIYGTMQGILGMFQSGMIGYNTAAEWIQNAPDQQGWKQLGQSLGDMIDGLGGMNEIAGRIEEYRTTGGTDNLQTAAWLEQALLMYSLTTGKTNLPDLSGMQTPERKGVEAMRDAIAEVYALQDDFTNDMFSGVQDVYNSLNKEQKAAWDKQVADLAKDYDLGFAGDEFGGYNLNNMFASWLGAYVLSNGKAHDKSEYAVSETAEFGSRDERHAYVDGVREQAEAEAYVSQEVQRGTQAYEQRAAQMQKLQGQISNWSDQVSALTKESESYAAQIAELENSFGPFTPDQMQQNQMQKAALESLKADTDALLTNAQDQLTALQSQMTDLQASPIELNIESNADEVAAGIGAAAAGPYTAEVAVVYNDPGFTPSGGGTVTVDVVYNDSGGPSSGSSGSSGKSGGSLWSKAANYVTSLFHAEGGRSDTPAIFGEAGPEWAIPEEHSDRTAELLNAAREASGFTWNELIARYGGLGGRTDGIVVNIGNYAPVINADNADGVEQKLIEDKARLKDMVGEAVRDAMERNALHDAIEVYA
ncbi:MAG: phage tail tape measure protein [Succinivibrionaceae bacterium]|nr:phage tail tape measure protein [Succinivibrionaceae bacterium]